MRHSHKTSAKPKLQALEEKVSNALKKGDSASLILACCFYKIKSRELYKEKARTMGGYAKQWNMSPARASRLAAAGYVNQLLRPLWKQPGAVKPNSESQLRPLTKLESNDDITEAWLAAVAVGAGAAPTAQQVADQVQSILVAKGSKIATTSAKACILQLNFKGREYLYTYLVEKAKKAGRKPGEVAMETLEIYSPVLPPVVPSTIEIDEVDTVDFANDQDDPGEYDIDQAYLAFFVTSFFRGA